ncbi:asparagine synthase C-terminal domain-containing protein [Vibrio mytili]|uniref:asparagine synthase-related protein n=1 Tax=Vibrio mytili TaxID=50718 RepID=UPI003C703CA9
MQIVYKHGNLDVNFIGGNQWSRTDKLINEVHYYLVGDIYSFNGKHVSNSEFLELCYNRDNEDFFRLVDGYYILFEIKKGKVKVISDRYALLPLYYYSCADIMICSTDFYSLTNTLKSENLDLTLNNSAIKFYLSHNSFPYDHTLYTDVKRINPSSIIEINQLGEVSKRCYWSWRLIEKKTINFDEAIDKLHTLLQSSMQKRFSPRDKVSVTLSGGLDSRLLLALADEMDLEIECFTFGTIESPDVVIAKKCCEKLNVRHKVIEINERNWFLDREDAVIRTGGMANILHLHAVHPSKEIVKHSNVVLNGFLGDLVLGGGYLKKDLFLNINSYLKTLKGKYGDDLSLININDEYYNENITDSYFIHNRGVRFTSLGSDAVSDKINNVKPFLDNELLEFVYSLPDEYRFNGKLYHAMLLKYYPDLFLDIEWQKTGTPISLSDSKFINIYHQLFKVGVSIVSNSKFNKIARKIYSIAKPKKVDKMKSFVDYKSWVSSDFFQSYKKELLCGEVSYLQNHVDIENIIDDENKLQELGCLISLEYFLKKVESC